MFVELLDYQKIAPTKYNIFLGYSNLNHDILLFDDWVVAGLQTPTQSNIIFSLLICPIGENVCKNTWLD